MCVLEVPVPSQESERSCICVLRCRFDLFRLFFFWFCSDGVVFCLFSLFSILKIEKRNRMEILIESEFVL